MTYTINGKKIGSKTISVFGLEPQMLQMMTDAQIAQYFSPESLQGMFGMDVSIPNDRDLAALASAAIDLRDQAA